MIIISDEHADVPTPTGLMRTHLFRPVAAGRYPAILLYSEIYQVTAPIRRMAAFIAGQGFLVGVPEVYHEFEALGTVLAYDTTGTDRGNALKTEKEVAAFDSDARAGLDYLATHPASTGRLGAMGVCLGGHLAFRAAMNPDVSAAACFYPTDIHKGSLGKGMSDNSLARIGEIKGELLLVWGRQDPHVPLAGRNTIREHLEQAETTFQWHEVNAAHAFLRDEGPRYDSALAYQCYGLGVELLHRRLR